MCGAKDVGISTRRGARCVCPLSRAREARKVSATCNGYSIAETDGSLVLPEVLRPATSSDIQVFRFLIDGVLYLETAMRTLHGLVVYKAHSQPKSLDQNPTTSTQHQALFPSGLSPVIDEVIKKVL